MDNEQTRKEKADKFLMDYFEKLKISDEKRKEIFSNTDYMMWLENFTTYHPSFSDDNWLYFPEKISKEDNEKVNNLSLLYEGIEIYAKKNYIYPTECDFGGYYRIKLDNVGYEIGKLVGQGTLFFCDAKPLNKNLEYIDFYDIMNDKKKDGVDVITEQLKNLSNGVLELYKQGVPLAAIIETLDTTLTKVKKDEKEHTKTLKRD